MEAAFKFSGRLSSGDHLSQHPFLNSNGLGCYKLLSEMQLLVVNQHLET